jgi:hypothetical protein
MASRDELLDHLLAMGFSEADCLEAIVACGKNVDIAITWLCERPSSVDTGKQKVLSTTNPVDVKETKPLNGQVKRSVPKNFQQSTLKPHTLTELAIKPLKEKDIKEELRRINRAWNAKAEDEKKKVNFDFLLNS